MKNKLFFLIAILIATIITQTNGFAQMAGTTAVPNNEQFKFNINDVKVVFENGSILKNGELIPKNNSTTNNLRTGSCPVPVWDATPGKVVNCNASCVTLDVRDSSGASAIGDYMQQCALFYIMRDAFSDAQNTFEVFLNGSLFVRIGPANTSPGGGVPTYYYPWSAVGPPGAGPFRQWVYGICPTSTLTYKWYDSGANGSFPWQVSDRVTGAVLGSGTFAGVVNGVSTGTYTNWAGTGTWSCPTCPGVSLAQFCPNGYARFCPGDAKPGKYGIKYTFDKGPSGNPANCTNFYWDTITVNSIYNTNWTSPGSVCAAASYNLNNYLSGSATPGGTWSGTGVSGNTFTPIGSGPVSITYTVGAGTSCETTETHTITVIAVPNVTITPPGPLSYCVGTTVNLTLTASGANTYVWTNTAETTPSITVNPTSNETYTVTGTSVQGCKSTATVTVNFSPRPNIGVSSQTDVNCKGGTGSATVTANGGSGSGYTYTWLPGGSTNPTQSTLTAGTYTVTVSDGNTCSRSTTVTITEPAAVLSAGVSSQTNVNCKGQNTGAVTITASGGTSPYTYSWLPSGLGTSPTASNLTAGTYTVTVTDNKGCTKTATATITEPAAVLSAGVSSQTPASCGQSNGSAIITATGGTSPYTYSWSPVGGNSATASNIPAGSYVITVTDNKGCTKTASLTINNANGPSVSVPSQTNPACAGGTGAVSITATGGSGPYTYVWSSGLGTNPAQSNLTAGSYTVTVTDATGCTGNKIVTITQPNAITIAMNPSNATCGNNNGSITASASGGTGAFTYSWTPVSGTNPTLNGLSGGFYTVTVTDASGCTATKTAAITQSPAVTTSVSSTDASCGASDGSVSVTAGGGTGSYTYLWTPGGSTNPSTNNLAAGNYTVTVTDISSGCTATNSVTVNQSGAVNAGFTPSPTSGASPLPVVFTNTSTGATIYKWSFGDGTTDTLINPSHIYTKNGSYTVKLVVYNAAGCSDSITYIIVVNDETVFCVPNVFTPNGDGTNDVFKLCGSGMASIEASIYDRWGLKMYTWNTTSGGWDGRTASGDFATDGTYYYIIKAVGFNKKEYSKNGFVMLLR